jgi:alkylation response protein AidB-like acyl-CoA dehydrogenase
VPLAITDDHAALASSVASLLQKRDTRAAARALLEAPDEPRPALWGDLVALGLTGLHLPEEHGGSGAGLEELAVVVEQLGAALAPGPFVPTAIAGATLAATAPDDVRKAQLPGFADGSRTAGVAFGSRVVLDGERASGEAGTVLGAGLADVLLVPCGADVLLVEVGDVTVTEAKNLDPTRRSARVTLDAAPVVVLPGAAQVLTDVSRTLLSAEAVGVARACTSMAAEYAKVREQFGRPIATFQAVKHHCANMLVATELATAAVWDAARADEGDERSYAAAVAATLAGPAADLCANLCIQVHGGIGYTWEHDAHLFLRRATVLKALLDPEAAAADTTALTRRGVVRARTVQLPPEAEPIRADVRAFVDTVRDLEQPARLQELIRTGYAMPHWPRPWGREAGAVEQLVIEEEFGKAGIKRPALGITGWVILTLVQHATEEQVQRWVPSAVAQEVIWCQLFSEPGAGSDAAGVRTRATKVDGGWLVNGQKVWTSGAHVAARGFATVRTNPDVPKHQGITTMVIDMKAPGVEVRPLRMTTGTAEFNEVFFNDVFVPDADVVGPIDGGWTVARATLGNESVSIGGGDSGYGLPGAALLPPYDAAPERLTGGDARFGRYTATFQAMGLLNLRSAQRAVTGGGPGAEGNITKLVLSELGHEAAAILGELAGPDLAFLDGAGMLAGGLGLGHRGLSIAGGTSEIKRNQIAERILGLPRDPLIS